MGCGFGGADENGVGETVNDRARRARHGDGGDRRRRQCRQQHDAAGAAAIDAKLAVGVAREGRGLSEMIGMADDAARMGCITPAAAWAAAKLATRLDSAITYAAASAMRRRRNEYWPRLNRTG